MKQQQQHDIEFTETSEKKAQSQMGFEPTILRLRPTTLHL